MTTVTIELLTKGTVSGDGIFDKLMQVNKAHLDVEWNAGRFKGAEYSTVYLGMLQATMNAALGFLASQQKIGPEADLILEQIANAKLEGKVLVAQECKLRAEFDLTVSSKLKTDKEVDLLAQKIMTEKAQTQNLGVDDNSVIGKQKALYEAQTRGFRSDALQKATKLWMDSWSARRMTDEGTIADGTNKLEDASGGRLMTAMMADVGA